MWNRIKSRAGAVWVALVSCAWLVPLALAGNHLLAYLNDDLARLHVKAAAAAGFPSLLDINESPNITAARVLLLASALLLAVAVVFWSLRLHRGQQAEADQTQGLRSRLQSRERMLEVQFQQLEVQLHRGRDALLHEYGRIAETASPASVAAVFDSRFERLESLLSRHLGEMDRRLGAVEGAMRSSGEQLAHQFGDLRERVVRGQSVNASNFGDLASAPMPLGGLVGDNAQLRDIVLNLKHLQEDLRHERRQLRQKLQNLPDASAAPQPSPRKAAG
ncbi:hypothetical protein [Sphaerotilus sp.]|uniref:hypothetical protein n=1 Tax=Sphaerotilus sp. TaxID=2093942 RepID=UPI002ACE1793|nr:hypothetical protein [Sphaerotilus sp.]MDZ7855355.1 hypothetical protein [Sphaerotilus sp.]